MRKLIIELVGIIGVVAFSVGVYLQFGTALALIIIGALLTLGAVIGTKRGKQ